MVETCINCKYAGVTMTSKGLVCSFKNEFKEIERTDSCCDFILNKEVCRCGNHYVHTNSFSPEDKPYVIRTEYKCSLCGSFWYEDD